MIGIGRDAAAEVRILLRASPFHPADGVFREGRMASAR